MEKDLEEFIKDVITKSGDVALKYFRKNSSFDKKMDGSNVTKADKDIEKYMSLQIKKQYPHHAILGEEFGSVRGALMKAKNNQERLKDQPKFMWVIDPIDGTSSFISGKPSFCTLIALLKDGKPVLGAAYQPFTKELWFGNNSYSEYNGKKLKKVDGNSSAKIISSTTSQHLLNKKGQSVFNKIIKMPDNVTFGGDAYNYCLLASGYISVIYEQNLRPYDYLPLLPILNGVGATIHLEHEKQCFEDNLEVFSAKNLLVCSSQKILLSIT